MQVKFSNIDRNRYYERKLLNRIYNERVNNYVVFDFHFVKEKSRFFDYGRKRKQKAKRNMKYLRKKGFPSYVAGNQRTFLVWSSNFGW